MIRPRWGLLGLLGLLGSVPATRVGAQTALDAAAVIRGCEAGLAELRRPNGGDGRYVVDQEIRTANADGTGRSSYRQRYTIWIKGADRRLDRQTYGVFDDDPKEAEKMTGMVGTVGTVFADGRLFLVGRADGADKFTLKEIKRGVPFVLNLTISDLLESPYVYQGVPVASFLKDEALTIDRVESQQEGDRELVRVAYHRMVKGRPPKPDSPETGVLVFEPARHWAIVHSELLRPEFKHSTVTDTAYEGGTARQKTLKNRFINGKYRMVSEIDRTFEVFEPGAPDAREFTLEAFGLKEPAAGSTAPAGP